MMMMMLITKITAIMITTMVITTGNRIAHPNKDNERKNSYDDDECVTFRKYNVHTYGLCLLCQLDT
jgi:hypothetical protein